MTDPAAKLAVAEAEAVAARARLSVTLTALQYRLEPGRLARDAKRELTDVGEAAAQRTVAAVRRRPGALAGTVALAGLFLARHRLVALFGRKATRRDDGSYASTTAVPTGKHR